MGLNRNTVNRYHSMLRARIAEVCEADSPFDGEAEADESRFGARRVRGKTIVFRLLKRGGKAYTQIVPDVTRRTLMRVIDGKVSKDSIMYTDGFSSYDGLVDWGCKHHYRVSHGENEFVERGNPGNLINGIESFWGHAKNRLVKYHGIKGGLPPPSEGMRVQVQRAGAGHVRIHATGTPREAPKLGKPK